MSPECAATLRELCMKCCSGCGAAAKGEAAAGAGAGAGAAGAGGVAAAEAVKLTRCARCPAGVGVRYCGGVCQLADWPPVKHALDRIPHWGMGGAVQQQRALRAR